ncbi:GerAB/ArcD/ProY family transporter [Clostridium magnum]|uniref:Spore germination protein YndE n=1 Tax=Clostridium magnum DSM 2767 TaxID=1121326 RepID=A0A162TKI5_9CLOT|nr:GerAB/ArcD/ProY family transporter [Clostridium magnum]KZL92763.1 spore germination protein YndE [Clostridium magnum DSM 2767]SHJ53271.1 spore germination protein (amino acid permease) [Clostridium magnum DSM 2767]
MNKNVMDLLTPNQVMCVLIGYTMGVGILSLPNSLVKDAYQDAWISAALGGIYPLYMSLIAIYISNKFPKDNILILSKRFYGNFIGSIFNFIFLTFFATNFIFIASGFSSLSRVYAIDFLAPEKVAFCTVFIASYASYKGLKTLGKINEFLFYIQILLILSSIGAIHKGSILNIRPMFQSSLWNILKSVKESIFSYGGVEAIFLIYPSINDSNKVNVAVLKYTMIIIITYVYVTFITIFYYGVDIIPKNLWSFTAVTESFSISPIINFRFVFIFMWILMSLKLASNYCYASLIVLTDFFKKVPKIRLIAIIYCVIVYFIIKLPNETIRRHYIEIIFPKYIIFTFTYISLIALLIFFKKGEKNEKN